MNTFSLRIVTPVGDHFAGEVEYFSVDAPDGRVGFMRGASPRVIAVEAGRAEITANGKKTVCYCSEGILRVDERGVTLMTVDCRDSAEPPEKKQGTDNADISRAYKFAKAKLASSILRSKQKKGEDFF